MHIVASGASPPPMACEPAPARFVTAAQLHACGAVEPILALSHVRGTATAMSVGVVYLYVPKAASSANRMYIEQVLNGSAAGRWSQALAAIQEAQSAAVTLTFTRDPAARFMSAVGTILHRYNFSEVSALFYTHPCYTLAWQLRDTGMICC